MKTQKFNFVGGDGGEEEENSPFEYIARRLMLEAVKLDVVRAALEDMGHAELAQKVREACAEINYDADCILKNDFELED